MVGNGASFLVERPGASRRWSSLAARAVRERGPPGVVPAGRPEVADGGELDAAVQRRGRPPDP